MPMKWSKRGAKTPLHPTKESYSTAILIGVEAVLRYFFEGSQNSIRPAEQETE